MSGIVRGYVSGAVTEQMYGFAVVTVNNVPFTLPVAVVPLDDATLFAMARTIQEMLPSHIRVDEVEIGLRAALKLN